VLHYDGLPIDAESILNSVRSAERPSEVTTR
jgi:hypothetical protein